MLGAVFEHQLGLRAVFADDVMITKCERPIGWPPQLRAWQHGEVPSCKLRLCSPILFGISPCECVKRNPNLPPSSRGELKWELKMLDLRAICRRNLVFSIDGDHVHLHGCASNSYFKKFVCRWFSDHPLR